jgi:hypothetical protein
MSSNTTGWSLDSAMSEFEQAEASASKTRDNARPQDDGDQVDYAGNRSALVKSLRDANPILRGRFDDGDIMDLALATIFKNEAYERAFADRANNPGVWRAIAKEIGAEVSNRLVRLRAGKRDRDEAAHQAEQDKIAAMSDGEYRRYLHKNNPTVARMLGL